jgi:hypothetical protein
VPLRRLLAGREPLRGPPRNDFVLPWKARASAAAAAAADPDANAPKAEAKAIDPLEEKLRSECGAPFIPLHTGFKINHSYFVRRFLLEHRVLFETSEGAFFLYDDTTGAWNYVNHGVVKELLRSDWLRIAPIMGGDTLSILGTDSLLDQFTRGIRSASGVSGIFKRLPRGLIHVGNGMLQIYADRNWELHPFSHGVYSRNPITINYDPNAKCERFREFSPTLSRARSSTWPNSKSAATSS